MFGTINTDKICDCKFKLSHDSINKFYGLSSSISAINTSIINVLVDFKIGNTT